MKHIGKAISPGKIAVVDVDKNIKDIRIVHIEQLYEEAVNNDKDEYCFITDYGRVPLIVKKIEEGHFDIDLTVYTCQ